MKHAVGFSGIFSKALIFALLGWFAFQPDPVIAKIYKYKDEHGKIHFTDDASKIPLRYRNRRIYLKVNDLTNWSNFKIISTESKLCYTLILKETLLN